MAQKGHWVRRLSDSSQLYGQSLPGIPVIEIAGDCRVLIERHGGVLEYGPHRICVRVKYGIACVLGCNLQLKQMSNQQLIISGQIDAVQIQRRC